MNSERQQLLLELIYDLLPANEAADLHALIARDPEWRADFQSTQRLADTIAQAALLSEPTLSLRRLDEVSVPSSSFLPLHSDSRSASHRSAAEPLVPTAFNGHTQAGLSSPYPSPSPADLADLAHPSAQAELGHSSPGHLADPHATSSSTSRAWQWAAGLAAAALLCLTLGNRCTTPSVASEDRFVRLLVTGPALLTENAPGRFDVLAASPSNQPLPAEIEYTFRDPRGRPLATGRGVADTNGRFQVLPPAGLTAGDPISLRVVARRAQAVGQVELPIAASPAPAETIVATDQLNYQPGEIVNFRSVTLHPTPANSASSFDLRCEIRDPSGQIVANPSVESVSQNGVLLGKVALPPELPPGNSLALARAEPPPTAWASYWHASPSPPATADESLPQPSQPFNLRFHQPAIGQPLQLEVSSPQDNLPAVVAAYAGNVQVSQSAVTLHRGKNSIELSPPANALAPTQIALFGYAPPSQASSTLSRAPGADNTLLATLSSPPNSRTSIPAASSPVPLAIADLPHPAARSLQVQLRGAKPNYAPGDKVELAFQCVNEAGARAPATLGVSVLTWSEQAGAADPALVAFNTRYPHANDSNGDFWNRPPTRAAASPPLVPPAVADNLPSIRAQVEPATQRAASARAASADRLARFCLLGGLILLAVQGGLWLRPLLKNDASRHPSRSPSGWLAAVPLALSFLCVLLPVAGQNRSKRSATSPPIPSYQQFALAPPLDSQSSSAIAANAHFHDLAVADPHTYFFTLPAQPNSDLVESLWSDSNANSEHDFIPPWRFHAPNSNPPSPGMRHDVQLGLGRPSIGSSLHPTGQVPLNGLDPSHSANSDFDDQDRVSTFEFSALNSNRAFVLPPRSQPPVQILAARPILAPGDDSARQLGKSIYWNPLLSTDRRGFAQVQFTLPAEGAYRVIVDAHDEAGRLGSATASLRAE